MAAPRRASGELWRYADLSLKVTATLVRGRKCYLIPTHPGEGWGHVLLKIGIAAHLLSWGYGWERIHWEEAPAGAGEFRPDIYAERGRRCWGLCGGYGENGFRTAQTACR